eukprot:GFYU01002079.1.p1 GENE.GFYU01002079.1~~GFYU01002079.1.p1  ORF type:complete len:285 (-),score=65.21 GFYU01002079.1:339-1193(-)
MGLDKDEVEKLAGIVLAHSGAMFLCSFVFLGVGYDNWDEEGDPPFLSTLGFICLALGFVTCCCAAVVYNRGEKMSSYSGGGAPTFSVEGGGGEGWNPDNTETVPSYYAGWTSAVPEAIAEKNIWEATRDGNVDRVRALLDQGQDMNAVSPNLGYSLLMIAAENGRLQIVTELMQRGVDATRKSPAGYNATDLAGFAGMYDCANYLFNSGYPGAAPNAPGTTGPGTVSAVASAGYETGVNSAYGGVEMQDYPSKVESPSFNRSTSDDFKRSTTDDTPARQGSDSD